MKRIMNITTHTSDMQRYGNREEIEQFYRSFGLDGLELLESGKDEKGLFDEKDVVGVHLKYFPCWYCLWKGDWDTVLEEFGTEEDVRMNFGGTDRAAILEAFRKNLEFARRYKPEYTVFHVSDVLLSEAVSRRYRYTDEEIVDAAAELINELLPKDEGFELLLENLWWPGLTMTRPRVTERLLSQIRYPRKGIMLDVGHLLHTNTAVRTPREGAAYIREVLGRYEDLSIIKGIHFHQTLEGAFVEEQKKHPPVLKGSYYEKMCSLAEYVCTVDSHKPFLCTEAAELIKELAPKYLVFELLSSDKKELAGYLKEQTAYF